MFNGINLFSSTNINSFFLVKQNCTSNIDNYIIDRMRLEENYFLSLRLEVILTASFGLLLQHQSLLYAEHVGGHKDIMEKTQIQIGVFMDVPFFRGCPHPLLSTFFFFIGLQTLKIHYFFLLHTFPNIHSLI